MSSKRVEQGNYYSIVYGDDKSEEIIETNQELKVGCRYKLNDRVFVVKAKKNYNLTLEDIDNIRVLTEGYEDGTGRDIYHHVMDAWERKIPNVRFSNEEKDFLSYVYYENEHISADERISLAKILNKQHEIKELGQSLKRKGR